MTGIDITSGFSALAFPAEEHSALLAKKAEGSLTGDETLRLDDLEDLLRCLRREFIYQRSRERKNMTIHLTVEDGTGKSAVFRLAVDDVPEGLIIPNDPNNDARIVRCLAEHVGVKLAPIEVA